MPDAHDLPELFAAALELDGAGRAELLGRLRADAPATATRLEELLLAAERDGSLLDRSAPVLLPDDEATALPERVGSYRILREIGRGGMGRVFLAEQEGEAFRRRVALKILDGPGVAGDRLRRFREEVRILATLEHPGIARFLDGGRAAAEYGAQAWAPSVGTWFLALEYVRGVDLLTHCRTLDLPIPARVRLLLDTVEAVAYAHERGVVHRDLKPGNILVGADGRPRLLDFGISKLADPDDAERPATRTELRAFTPAYASPEQFRGESATAASDIFSLGVMLYELVSGVRPFGSATTPPNVLAAAVLAADPEPPSAAARREDTARRRGAARETASATEPGAHPASEVASPAPLRRFGAALPDRDLDAICLEALQREPTRRYSSAAAFAADLSAYLEGRPVAARRGGARYRLARFARRHRAAVLGGAALLVVLGASLTGVWSLRRPRRPPDPPPRAFPYSGVETQSLDTLASAFALHPASVESGAQLALAQIESRRFQEAALTVRRLREIPGAELDPLTDYVEATLAQERNELQRALVLFSRGLEAARAGGRGELVAQIQASRGTTLLFIGRHDEAHVDMTAARIVFAETHDWASLGRVLNDLAIERLISGDLVRGEALITLARRAVLERAPTESQGAKALIMLANLGAVSMERGRCDTAVERFEELEALSRTAARQTNRGLALARLAFAHWACGRTDGVDADFAEAQRVLRGVEDPAMLALALSFAADVAAERGNLAEVLAVSRELRRLAEKTDSEALGNAERLEALVAVAEGRDTEARARFAEARNLLIASGGDNFASAAAAVEASADLDAGDSAQAAAAAEAAAIAFRGRTPLGDSASLEAAEVVFARIDARSGRLGDAARRLAAVDAAHPGGAASQPAINQRLAFLAARAELARLEGRTADARQDLERAIAEAAAADRVARTLALRLALAELDPANARASASAIERAARAHGLLALAQRARAVSSAAAKTAERVGGPVTRRAS